jgi:hypothetical protein
VADVVSRGPLSDGLVGGYVMFIVLDPCEVKQWFWRELVKSVKHGQSFVVWPTHSFRRRC